MASRPMCQCSHDDSPPRSSFQVLARSPTAGVPLAVTRHLLQQVLRAPALLSLKARPSVPGLPRFDLTHSANATAEKNTVPDERTGPPDGGPVRVAPTGRVSAGVAWQTNDAANRRISRRIGGDGPAGVSTTAGLAKSVWQAVTRSVRTSAGPGTGRVLFPWGHRGKKEPSPATLRGQAACVRRGGALG